MKYIFIVINICLIVSLIMAQGPKRNRAEGFYQCAGSNTIGDGNTWVTARGIGFLWDNGPDSTPKPFPFLEVASETGLSNFMSLLVESRILSYPWNKWFQFGNFAAGARFTVPNNKELRFRGYGLECKWIYNSQPNFPSLSGYRVGGTGFAPEGYIVQGSNLQWKFLYDMDFISQYSWLPLKIDINAGMRIPFAKASYILPQYLFDAGVAYTGLGFDFFAEYSLEAFNNLMGPKKIVGLDNVGFPHASEVFFWENPMYVSVGGRIRYENGMTLFACVPFLVSANVGSSMTTADRLALSNSQIKPGDPFYDEHLRGINDPFDPWFAKWKIVAEISFPIRYKQTGAEMMRNFLLLKNRKEGPKIDIDERLKKMETPSDSLKNEDSDKKRRLEEIRKRREQIDKGE
jgi:hypothetical protein